MKPEQLLFNNRRINLIYLLLVYFPCADTAEVSDFILGRMSDWGDHKIDLFFFIVNKRDLFHVMLFMLLTLSFISVTLYCLKMKLKY